jgi:2-haloacid dehalogenase
VVENLQRIKNMGHTIYLASGNTRENRMGILKSLDIDTFFTDVFAAQTIGYQKQQRQFWERVLSDLSANVSNITVVGNQLNDDIQHPLALGMQTILINRYERLSRKETVENIVPGAEICSLTELSI